MAARADATRGPAVPLSRTRALDVAVRLADANGIASLTMRGLARELGVEAMSLYHHVANKDDILDGMVDLVFGEIETPSAGTDWRTSLHRRAHSARSALRRHPWALALMESRTAPGPATLRHHNAVLGCLRRAGFSIESTAHAYALLDSYVYGFVHQEVNLPFETTEESQQLAHLLLAAMPAETYPHLVEFASEHVLRPGYRFADEFEVGLGLVLDSINRMRQRQDDERDATGVTDTRA